MTDATRRQTTGPGPAGLCRSRRRGFSLVELMVAIVILGLGMVMVATVFPVAWGRARDLSEFTSQQSITPAAHNLATRLMCAAPKDLINATAGPSFAGDLTYNSQDNTFVSQDPAWINETWVHAVNTENIRIDIPAFVAEDPWLLERSRDLWDPGLGLLSAIVATSYVNPQVAAQQRFHPPLRRRNNVDRPPRTKPADVSGVFLAEGDEAWDNAVASRRFAWAAFYRIPERVDPKPLWVETSPGIYELDSAKALEVASHTRQFDLFYVTLRRTRPTNRYARQASDDATTLPNPFDITAPLVVPEAMDPKEDVMFPVAWRVQVEFPASIVPKYDPLPPHEPMATNIPTEIRVPPTDYAGTTDDSWNMLVTMFPRGTQFIDEITGLVFRVTQVRETIDPSNPDRRTAFLTLDREVLLEDLELEPFALNPTVEDYRCDICVEDVLDPAERFRTVRVFPPPTQEREQGNKYPTFAGNPPVVDIDVQTVSFAPEGQ